MREGVHRQELLQAQGEISTGSACMRCRLECNGSHRQVVYDARGPPSSSLQDGGDDDPEAVLVLSFACAGERIARG